MGLDFHERLSSYAGTENKAEKGEVLVLGSSGWVYSEIDKGLCFFFLLPLLLLLLHLLYLTIVSCPSLPFAIRSMFFDLSHASLLVFFSYCTFSTFCLIPSILHSRLGMALDVYSLVHVRICFNMSTNIPLDSPTRLVCQTVFLGFFRWCCCWTSRLDVSSHLEIWEYWT